MAQDEAREVYPVVFHDPLKNNPALKDFAIRPVPSDFPEPPEVVEEVGPDPKDSSATESATFSDLIPTEDAVSEEGPVGAERDLEPTSTVPSTPTSSPPPATSDGKPSPPVTPPQVTTPSSSSPRKAPAKSSAPTKPSESVSSAP